MSEISQKQIEANRENAKLGGVKTEEGKAVSRYNAIKHGLLSEQVILEGDDEEKLLELGKRIRSELEPKTEIEFLLVDRIVSGFWRLKRALSIEKDEALEIKFFNKKLGLSNDADLYFRYEAMLERSIYKALHELERIQAKRKGENPPPPIAMDIDISGENRNGFVS